MEIYLFSWQQLIFLNIIKAMMWGDHALASPKVERLRRSESVDAWIFCTVCGFSVYTQEQHRQFFLGESESVHVLLKLLRIN
jgi:hypothetical protein